MKSAKFISGNLEPQFCLDGFIHIPSFINQSELASLTTLFNSVYAYTNKSQGMWNSLFNLDSHSSNRTSKTILDILKVKLESTFENFKAPVASFMVKNPNEFGITDLHRDYSTQDEQEFQYRNIWIPLVDTTPQNGALYALKRSHTFFDYPLPMFCKWEYIEFQDMLFKHCDVINAKAGDLVVYADRTLHGSFINRSSVPRPVVHFGLLHPDAELCYYYLDEETKEVSVYDVPFSFFFENKYGNQDGRHTIRKRFKYHPPQYSKEDLLKGLQLR